MSDRAIRDIRHAGTPMGRRDTEDLIWMRNGRFGNIFWIRIPGWYTGESFSRPIGLTFIARDVIFVP